MNAIRDRYFYPDQYSNPANWRAHYETTAVEIIEQTGGRITHFVAGLGTGGTFIGTSRRLREWRPSVRLISVQPESALHGLEGLKHMASAIVPPIYDPAVADRDERVSTEDAYRWFAGWRARKASSSDRPAARRSRPACASPRARPRRDRHDLSG